MSRRRCAAPRLARWLLAHLLPREEREFVIGDLEEAFAARIAAAGDLGATRRWYWRTAVGAIAALACRGRHVRRPQASDRRAQGDGLMKNLLRDARYGLRLLVSRPGFTAVAVLTLALGIGANSAIFTVAHTLLLKPLPYADAEQLVIVSENNLSRGWPKFSVSPANFLDWREQNQSFAQLAAWGGRPFNYTGGDTPERLSGLAGTEGFLELLGGAPVLGRGFRPEEFEPGHDLVVILGHGLWERLFGGRGDVLDEPLTLNGLSYRIVGVMHPNWSFGGRDVALFVPRAITPRERAARGAHFLNVIGRMHPGVTAAHAQTEMTTIAARLEAQYPDTNKGWGAVVTPLRDSVVGHLRPMLLILLSAVGVVLLIACANVANMLLARATVRAREMAIRRAIGAGRGRIIQQLLTESVLLAALGAALGLLLAHWGLASLVAAYPDLLPRASAIGVDRTVLAFTAALAVLTATLFGLAPAVAAARSDLFDSLKEGGRPGSGGGLRQWLRSSLVVSEVALALVLLVGAGLLLKSYALLARAEPGFATDNRLTMTTLLPRPKYEAPERMMAFYDQALERLATLPGVESLAVTSLVPISGNDEIYSIEFVGRPPLPPGEGTSALYYLVSPEYFDTMGIPLLKGRGFTRHDRDGAPRVAIINEALARMHYPDEDPVGRQIRIGRNSSVPREIVGIVGSVKHYGLGDKDQAQVYEPFRQMPMTGMSFILKTSVEPMTLAPAARQAIQTVDPEQPVIWTRTVDDLLADSVALPRVQTMLLGTFAGIALLLAVVGLYGVMSYAVSQRTQEIGIRMALGAQPGSVLRLVLGQGLALTGGGLLIGIGAALLLARALAHVLEPLLFQVSPSDVATLAVVPVVLSVVSLLATLIPARRATRIDPIQSLRSE